MDSYPAKPTSLRSEDWTAVWLGAALILLVLVGVRPAIPVFSWSTAGFGQTLA